MVPNGGDILLEIDPGLTLVRCFSTELIHIAQRRLDGQKSAHFLTWLMNDFGARSRFWPRS